MARQHLHTTYPRAVKPELVEIGDDIEVTLPKIDGCTHTLRGVVGSREDHGSIRYLRTKEGYTLMAWEPGVTALKITLHGRTPVNEQSLFEVGDNFSEFMAKVKERIDT